MKRNTITLDSLKGKTLGFDSYNILYQFLSSIRGMDGTPLMDSKGNVTSHLTGLLYRTINLMGKEVRPVFVFDGEPSELKRETLRKRTEIRTEAEKKHKEALKKGEMEEARKMGARALKMTRDMVEEAQELVKLMGLPCIQAPSEGESQLAFMEGKGDIAGVVSQDFDCLLFGARKIYRNITVSGKRKIPGKNIYIDVEPEMIDSKETLDELGIDRRKLIWLSILIGTDFNEKFPKIGPKTAFKLVKEFDSFEEIVKETGHEPDFDYKEVEKIFMEPHVDENYKVEFGMPDHEKVKEFLCEKHDFSKDRVENALKKLEKILNEKGQQSKLDKWF